MEETETERVVSELLESVITETTNRTEWDVTDRGRHLAEEEGDKPPTSWQHERHSGPITDLCSLIRERCPKRILVNYSLRGCGHTELIQLQCTDQKASGYCGHYAMYNAVCALEMCQSHSEEEELGFLHETISLGSFWRRYWWSVSQLLTHVDDEGGECWPWTRQYVQNGDMERSFLRYLLTTDPQLRALGAENKISVILSAYGFVQNSFSEVCAIQQKIDEFVSSSIPSHLVFILGVTNHWVTLLAYKTSALPSFSSARPSCHQSSSNSIISSPNLSSCSSTVTHTVNGCCVSKVTTDCHCSDKSVENDGGTLTTSIRTGVIYMDSNNVPVVGYTDNDIDAHLLKQEEERIKVKGKEYLSWKRETYRQAYKDQRELVRMLTSCVSGHGNLCEYVITDCISRLINSYNSCVEQRLSELADSDLFLPLLLDWLQSHYPPKSITELLQPLLEWGGQSAVLDPLRNWAEHVYALVLSLETSGLEAVDQFEQILSQVTCKLRLE